MPEASTAATAMMATIARNVGSGQYWQDVVVAKLMAKRDDADQHILRVPHQRLDVDQRQHSGRFANTAAAQKMAITTIVVTMWAT